MRIALELTSIAEAIIAKTSIVTPEASAPVKFICSCSDPENLYVFMSVPDSAVPTQAPQDHSPKANQQKRGYALGRRSVAYALVRPTIT